MIYTFQLGQLQTIVDAHHLGIINGLNGVNMNSIRDCQTDDIGQIIFALGVLIVQPVKPRFQQSTVDSKNARIGFMYAALLRIGIFFLNNSQHFATFIADDATIASRIVKVDRQQAHIFLIGKPC